MAPRETTTKKGSIRIRNITKSATLKSVSSTSTAGTKEGKEGIGSTMSLVKDDHGILSLRYEEAIAGTVPIPVTVAPPRQPPIEEHPALRARPMGLLDDEGKRDSGLAPTTSSKGIGGSGREGSLNSTITREQEEKDFVLGFEMDFNTNTVYSSPLAMSVKEPQTPTGTGMSKRTSNESLVSGKRLGRRGSNTNGNATPKTPKSQTRAEVESPDFSPITTTIPSASEGFGEDFMNMSFSKRGSVMLGGRKAVNGHLRHNGGRRQPSFSMLAATTTKILPEEVEKESQKVRSMYEQSAPNWEDGQYSSMGERLSERTPTDSLDSPASNGLLRPSPNLIERPKSAVSIRSEHERAGGIEDWEDVNGHDVDRYGFINKRRVSRPGTPEYRPPQRVSTALQLASETPRQKNRVFGRSPSTATSSREFRKAPNRKISAKSLKTQGSTSSRTTMTGRMRSVSNRLPGNQDRRWMDEAGDMLTLPPGLADIAEDQEGGKAADGLKKKEWERAEKWRKMAKVVKPGKNGEGMEFEFDTKNAKLIERTWKGIPDRWRSSAWYSFLATSAKKRKDSPTDESIITAFHKLLQTSSADDLQIDIDVPRTINSHIMFRRRYRGGQRLLFRVLHCLSLYYPETGYVQGMASLAATLLCYYDEEKAFIMLVRMWTLRGLAQLYANGFGGLMSALEEFQTKWLVGREVSEKLNELNIEPTAYGTRWYLTLFNYSIPFPAQLRVWDVFMLLGDSDLSSPATKERPFAGGLDVLHATSAALIDGTREILLDSDFENAMKVLTSWIPVKDEELLMRVAKAEWKLQRGRKGRKPSTP